jgi:hypothetical protein
VGFTHTKRRSHKDPLIQKGEVPIEQEGHEYGAALKVPLKGKFLHRKLKVPLKGKFLHRKLKVPLKGKFQEHL